MIQPGLAEPDPNRPAGELKSATHQTGMPTERFLYGFFILFGLLLVSLAFIFSNPSEIWHGSIVILTSPANLLTDYFELANIGAALFNAGAMALLSIGLVWLCRAPASGAFIAAVLTMAGFSFFGKNLLNSLPIIGGVWLYSRVMKTPMKDLVFVALFCTALGPLVSEIAFNLDLPLQIGLPLGAAAGILTGLVVSPLSKYLFNFHQGYNLYNTGFTTGIIGMFFLAVLRANGIEVLTVSIVSSGHNLPMAEVFLALFVLMFVAGFWLNGWNLRGYSRLLRQAGQLHTDFIQTAGMGLTLVNMAFLGILSVAYVLVNGGELNGPTIGGILTVTGFGAYGKHLRNVVPILAGVYLANLFNIYDGSSTMALTAALFGTTLAPIAGRYGVFAGILTGFLHMAMVVNIRDLHGGMNLYNNGFSGGFIAAVMVPLLNAFRQAVDIIRRKQ